MLGKDVVTLVVRKRRNVSILPCRNSGELTDSRWKRAFMQLKRSVQMLGLRDLKP